MIIYFAPLLLAVAAALNGCDNRVEGYVAASSISRNGFARNAAALRGAEGQVIRVWGYVDPANIGTVDAESTIDQDGRKVPAHGLAIWSFNVKARQSDQAGHSFAVHVPEDARAAGIRELLMAESREGKSTVVFLKGRLFTFDAPTNTGRLTGLYLVLESSRDLLLEPPEAE